MVVGAAVGAFAVAVGGSAGDVAGAEAGGGAVTVGDAVGAEGALEAMGSADALAAAAGSSSGNGRSTFTIALAVSVGTAVAVADGVGGVGIVAVPAEGASPPDSFTSTRPMAAAPAMAAPIFQLPVFFSGAFSLRVESAAASSSASTAATGFVAGFVASFAPARLAEVGLDAAASFASPPSEPREALPLGEPGRGEVFLRCSLRARRVGLATSRDASETAALRETIPACIALERSCSRR